ncbi:hypothetical protein FH972_026019 [Carpinus fangiana]|uniref:Endo-1,3(4)-beta-glucanase n=1 Tax=Carpinus fangiana TaxID=176857 RepID=A0A5N6L2Y7_9ROSI|nr:hypothetical protein FH972_026019 [Carpinus fangiana]
MAAVFLLGLVTAANAQTSFSVGNFNALFAQDSAVLQSLKPVADSSFDFSPSDLFPKRNGDGNYHTGDITLRFRVEGEADWVDDDSAAKRQPVAALPPESDSHNLSWDLTPTLPNSNSSLRVTRSWSDLDGDLALNFTIANIDNHAIEIGSLGFPIEFNNIFQAYTAEEVTQKCSLIDPYIGLGAGYVQVTRLTGIGPNLVITPLGDSNKFEAWRNLIEPSGGSLGYMSNPFEGFFEWQVYSKAYAEKEWNGIQQWNPATSLTIPAGESSSFAFRLSVSPTIHDVESTVAKAGLPYALGVPGYVIPRDLDARIFVNSEKRVKSIDVSPAGAISVNLSDTNSGIQSPWSAYSVKPGSSAFGRATVIINYDGGLQQSVHYYITAPGPDTLAAFGEFLTTKQHYTDASDPFKRAPSVISYDNEAQDFVLQERRVWIAGLSDDGGASSFLAASMKQAYFPSEKEVQVMESFVNETLWSDLQIPTGDNTYAVRKSLFYHDVNAMPNYPYENIDWSGWESWNKETGYDAIDRAYNYVHASAAHWALYRVGRNHPELLTMNNWQWYLDHAWNTVKFCLGSGKVQYSDLGLMVETVWGLILDDLIREGWTSQASELEDLLRKRQSTWSTRPNPFGSEQPWDSTGQEGVYYWSRRHFNDTVTADKTVASIRGFDPTVAHWAYNGNARRYWDFETAGKQSRIERQVHHYGSPLNALPLLENFRNIYSSDPQAQLDSQNFHDLRIGIGGIMAGISNIDEQGFGSMAFHSWPDALKWDAYSGDYGLAFAGHTMGTATYLIQHPTFGWLSFGGNVVKSDEPVVIEPKDSLRQRIYVGSAGLYVELESGAIKDFSFYPSSGKTEVKVVPQVHQTAANTDSVFLTYTSSASRILTNGLALERGGYNVPLDGAGEKVVTFEKA